MANVCGSGWDWPDAAEEVADSAGFLRLRVLVQEQSCQVRLFICLFGCLESAHFQKCHKERQRRFRALVLIRAVRMQAVAATAGRRVIQRNLEIVVAQKPVESRPGFVAPAMVSSHAVSL